MSKQDDIEREIPFLRRYAYALTRNADDADDLVHDCVARALSRWHLRRADGSVRAWLYRILTNLFLSDRRRASRRRTVVLDVEGDVSRVRGHIVVRAQRPRWRGAGGGAV